MKKALIALVILIAFAYLAVKIYLYLHIKQAADKIVADTADVVKLQYTGISSDLRGSAGLSDVRIQIPQTGEILHIEHITLHTPSLNFLLHMQNNASQSDFPEQLGLDLHGLNIDLNSQYAALLDRLSQTAPATDSPSCTKHTLTLADYRALGYETLTLDLSVRYHYHAQKDTLSIAMDILMPETRDLRLTADMHMPQLPSNPQAMQRLKPVLLRGTLSVQDRGLMDARMRTCKTQNALSQIQTIDALLQNTVNALHKRHIQADADMLQTYRASLQPGKTLYIEAQPAAPVDLTQIRHYKADDVPALLGLQMQIH